MKRVLEALLVTLFVSIVVACNSSQPTNSPSPRAPTAPGPLGDGPISMGTGDGGGGNTCKGKPIESYPYNVMNRPAFVKYVKPILDRTPEGDIRRLLTYAIRSKKWYAPPCDLKLLGAERIGTSIETEQGALQNFTEVWQSAKQLEEVAKRTDAERAEAELIVHEIGMSLRLIHLDSPKQQCLSYAPKTDYCEGWNENRKGQPKDLTKRDYEMVRRFTAEIFSFMGTTIEDWEDFLGTLEFEITDGKPMRTKAERQEYMASQIAESWKEAQISGHILEKGELLRHSVVEKTEKCLVKIEFAEDTESLRVQIETPRETLNGIFQMPTKVQPESQRSIRLSTIGLWRKTFSQRVGEKFFSGRLYMSGTSIVSVEMTEMIAVDDNGSSRNPRDGFTYFCSAQHISGQALGSR